MRRWLIGILVVLLAATGYFLWVEKSQAPTQQDSVNNVTTALVQLVVQAPLPLRYKDVARIDSITLVGTSTIRVIGVARGNWYFEGSFPLFLMQNAPNGNRYGRGVAQSQSDWMTTNYVPFVGNISAADGITSPVDYRGESLLIYIQKDNPSGLQEHDDFFTIPVLFE